MDLTLFDPSFRPTRGSSFWDIAHIEPAIYLFLALTHCKKLEAGAPKATPLSQLHEVTGRVRARTQDEHNGGVGGALLKNALEADHRGLHIPGEGKNGKLSAGLCLLTFTCVIFIPVQLQLSAESAGEVYIKGTESGQYLAMDTEGLLYGSVSVRPTPPDSAKA